MEDFASLFIFCVVFMTTGMLGELRNILEETYIQKMRYRSEFKLKARIFRHGQTINIVEFSFFFLIMYPPS